MRIMTARAIASIVWTGLTGGTKLVVKLLWTLNRGKAQVKKGAKSFRAGLVEYGIPEDIAWNITSSFTDSGIEMLKVRNLIKLVRELPQD